jgi:hypothetical protein
MSRFLTSLALLGLGLVGCKTTDSSKPALNELYIESHTITTLASRDLSGKTFTLENAEDVLNSSTEYRGYAQQISTYLTGIGLHEVEKSRKNRPDFEAVYKYSDSITNDNVKAKATTPRSRKFFGFSDNGENKAFAQPTSNGPVYHSELEVKIYLPLAKSDDLDAAKATTPSFSPSNTDNRKVVYESVSFGSSSDRNQRHVIPELIKFQLQGFPGSAGETLRTTVPLKNEKN